MDCMADFVTSLKRGVKARRKVQGKRGNEMLYGFLKGSNGLLRHANKRCFDDRDECRGKKREKAGKRLPSGGKRRQKK